MLKENTLFGERDKVAIAIDRLKAFCPTEGYHVAFSGGNDSQTVYHLCEMAGVPFDAHYTITSVDKPELVKFIKEQYKDGYAATELMIAAQPTVDAVPVVRCRECKHTIGTIYARDGITVFKVCELKHGTNRIDFYCKDGERRSE